MIIQLIIRIITINLLDIQHFLFLMIWVVVVIQKENLRRSGVTTSNDEPTSISSTSLASMPNKFMRKLIQLEKLSQSMD